MTENSLADGPIFVAQSGFPSAADAATQNSSSPFTPVVNSRPAATDTGATPSPSPSAFQTSGGPSFGQASARPVSADTFDRSGPRHCGQSAAGAAAARDSSPV